GAGMAGVIKMVMALNYGVLPKTLHVDAPTPQVDWSAGGVELLTEARAWPVYGRPRRAAVSAFGISGTNAHVIVEEAPEPPAEPESVYDGVLPLTLSAGNQETLREQAARLRSHLVARPELRLVDVAWSLATTRASLRHRAAVVVNDHDGALSGLAALARGESAFNVVAGHVDGGKKTVFVFSGQGSQWAGMALGLAASSPVFAEARRGWDEARRPQVAWSLADVLVDEEALKRVDVVQPAPWAVMVSLARLWASYGVRPAAVVGHSQGEIAAACVAGALSVEDAARVVAVRSQAL